jgi:hypothetical protein
MLGGKIVCASGPYAQLEDKLATEKIVSSGR